MWQISPSESCWIRLIAGEKLGLHGVFLGCCCGGGGG